MESPRPRVPARAGTPLLTPSPARVRIRRRDDAAAEPATTAAHPTLASRAAGLDTLGAASAALLVAAFALATTSRGDVVVLAALLGLGVGRRSSALAVAGALVATLVRWGSPSLHAIAGAQAVLGPAGWTGSNAAVAAAWLAAAALVLASRPRAISNVRMTAIATAPFAVAAADVVAGPSLGGALAVRVAASAAGVVLAVLASRWRRAPDVACALAVAAVIAAGLAR